MMRILKYAAGVIFMLAGAVKAAILAISAVQGAIEVPSNMSATQAALDSFLVWLAGSNQVVGYCFSASLFALGFGLLFWHPEKGWSFYFERPASVPKRIFSKPADKSKEFVIKPLEHIFAIFANHNDLQAEQLFSTYIGLWLRVDGKVVSIVDCKINFGLQLASRVGASSTDVVCMGIPKNDGPLLMRLEKNERIAVEGQIKECNRSWITLINCKIMATNLPALPLPIPAPQPPQSGT